MHLSRGYPYLHLYKSSSIIAYRVAFDGHPLLTFVRRFPDFRYWMYEVIQLSVFPRFRQMIVVDGADSVCCRRDLCQPLCFVLANLDNVFAGSLSPLSICWICTLSKLNFMML